MTRRRNDLFLVKPWVEHTFHCSLFHLHKQKRCGGCNLFKTDGVHQLGRRSISNEGIDAAGASTRRGGTARAAIALAIISTALPALGGIKIVAVSKPLLTQACPVFGTPSHPKHGMDAKRKRSCGLENSSNAFLAPRAIASFCATRRLMWVFREVDKLSHAETHVFALSSVHCPLRTMR